MKIPLPESPLYRWLVLLVVLPGIPFVLASLAIVFWANLPWPTPLDLEFPRLQDGQSGYIILVHGKGDNPTSWAEPFKVELETAGLSTGNQVVAIDWSDYADDLFRSTLNARQLGHQIGIRLARQPGLKRLHLLGHSAGSFLVYGICEAVKSERPQLMVQTTYLDPVTIYRGIDWHYGVRHFGSCADISDAYIDTEDSVPGSNAPLPHPHTFDTTDLRQHMANDTAPHLWPVEYYRRALASGQLPFWHPDRQTLERYPMGKATRL